jgi:hypothetical protein
MGRRRRPSPSAYSPAPRHLCSWRLVRSPKFRSMRPEVRTIGPRSGQRTVLNPQDSRASRPAAGHQHGPEIRTPGPGTLAVTTDQSAVSASGCHYGPVRSERQRLSLWTSPQWPPAAVTMNLRGKRACGKLRDALVHGRRPPGKRRSLAGSPFALSRPCFIGQVFRDRGGRPLVGEGATPLGRVGEGGAVSGGGDKEESPPRQSGRGGLGRAGWRGKARGGMRWA